MYSLENTESSEGIASLPWSFGSGPARCSQPVRALGSTHDAWTNHIPGSANIRNLPHSRLSIQFLAPCRFNIHEKVLNLTQFRPLPLPRVEFAFQFVDDGFDNSKVPGRPGEVQNPGEKARREACTQTEGRQRCGTQRALHSAP